MRRPEDDGDDGEYYKMENHIPRKAASPFHRVTDSVQTPQQHERRDARAQRQQDCERVHQLRRIREQHVQKCKALPAEFDRQPDQQQGGVVLPLAGGFPDAGGGQQRRQHGVGRAEQRRFPIAR